MTDGHFSSGPLPDGEPESQWPAATADIIEGAPGEPPITEEETPFYRPLPEEPGIDVVAERKRNRAERRRLLWKSPGFIFGLAIIVLWIVCGLFPSVLAPWGENEVIRLADGSTIPRQGPSSDAWFGTDAIGNDVFSRIIFGARPVLLVAPLAAAIAVAAGTVLGLIMGYYRGWADDILSRIVEAFLSIPVILLALMVLVVFGRTNTIIILTIALLFTPVVTRTVRSTVIAEAQLDYVTSAKLRGERGMFIMLREILPNITGVLVVEFTVRVGYAIFTIATLAFLGLTAGDATAADWGKDVANNYVLIQSGQWWASIFPAIAIGSLVIAINLIADSLDKVAKA
jgi:peptide/nickel transport system permease protein